MNIFYFSVSQSFNDILHKLNFLYFFLKSIFLYFNRGYMRYLKYFTKAHFKYHHISKTKLLYLKKLSK